MTSTQMANDTRLVYDSAGLGRPAWAMTSPLLLEYYDTEWGMPVHEESALLERLCLEGFQAGLSWELVLRKREAFRAAFVGFDADLLASFGEEEVERLMNNAGIIRNRLKINAVLNNAKATVALRETGGLDEFIWSFLPADTIAPESEEDIPKYTQEALDMSKALKKAGFKFVGPVTCFSLMTAIGMVDAHLVGSHRRGTSGIWPA
ncbi:DNA-3-methyladenine glycosylase I [Corynebacterium sp. Marseille-Q2823]|uniref:DNA-3-methyladenine glycosylase I n=1 Tax=Corynebacterium sp. Marseille-Q2823 TaxID=2736606 RepID=UPI001C37CC20|nr:DNA-3-methyladenine glycosylase I [Corynebacterium sp. Marseille-Q2823]